ncbi:protein-L-isoaspartate(D-aspartate) O-methyltransferase [Lebetimonas natsushimae]|uniref:Protein-L-isoaspartate O-methyltransferase n=1 Tax=Lebetimonas natsushimae TaxID=1936991 RepID=A0A292YB79_9BACT|nr:protein-L-isoaspartate(D-aspartate) O-methyltransferase [Lebetimonas natsushimae]GAX86786.1 protein-L-isoaspartate(D-aspartate) O-methyltransferase [Lebetimonas natsushimae]
MNPLADKLADYVNFSPIIYKAFSEIDRKFFVPIGLEKHAYNITPLPLADNSTISSPLTIAKMTILLEPENVDKVLEIGSGSGYQAAILSKIVRRVFTVERICPLVKEAKQKFEKLRLFNINIKCDDGRNGWREFAPYERILFSAATDEIPKELFAQLDENGFILAPINKENKQIITRFYKNGKKEEIEKCEFVPLKKGIIL